jgi:hypothetical protein
MMVSTAYCFTVMLISLIFLSAAYAGICRMEKSWINWYTFPAFMAIGANYLLPALYIWVSGPFGSYFSFTYCYVTYACASISLLLGSKLARSSGSLRPSSLFRHEYRFFPWILLAASIALYLPILIEFRQFLLSPREIYIRTRTGYGLNFFGSAVAMYLAFITYLFKNKKSVAGAALVTTVCVVLTYLHGSKGEILSLVEIFILYRVYILRKPVGLAGASASIIAMALAGVLSFALFGSAADIGELALSMAGYSNYTRNAMTVIDDPLARFYWGRLTVEDEVYSRVPRFIMSNKPKDYGSFKLASIYYPAWFQGDTGSPAFGIGVQYADFGVFAIVIICVWSILLGWLVTHLVALMKARPNPGKFLVLLFFAGVGIIPIGNGFLLPETVTLGLLLNFTYGHKLVFRTRPKQPVVFHSTDPSLIVGKSSQPIGGV